MEELRKHFRPEFLNRLDEIVVFQPLGREQLARIVDIQLRRLEQRLRSATSARGHRRAKDLLGDLGYDPTYGARPLKRAILRPSRTRWPRQCWPGPISPVTPSW